MNYIFLQLSGGSADMINLIIPVAMIAIFYFFMIRPQTKKQKEQRNFMDELKKGDNVVTASGILGRINKMEGEIVTLEVSTKTYLQVTKNAISKEMTEAVHDNQVAKAK